MVEVADKEKMLRSAGTFVVATIQGLLEASDGAGEHVEKVRCTSLLDDSCQVVRGMGNGCGARQARLLVGKARAWLQRMIDGACGDGESTQAWAEVAGPLKPIADELGKELRHLQTQIVRQRILVTERRHRSERLGGKHLPHRHPPACHAHDEQAGQGQLGDWADVLHEVAQGIPSAGDNDLFVEILNRIICSWSRIEEVVPMDANWGKRVDILTQVGV